MTWQTPTGVGDKTTTRSKLCVSQRFNDVGSATSNPQNQTETRFSLRVLNLCCICRVWQRVALRQRAGGREMGNPKQKWTSEEEEALRAGVAKHGTGKWKDIQRDPEFNPFLSSRSNIDLKVFLPPSYLFICIFVPLYVCTCFRVDVRFRGRF